MFSGKNNLFKKILILRDKSELNCIHSNKMYILTKKLTM